MKRVYRPTYSPLDWRDLTAGGERHWKNDHSAKCLAECWDSAGDFPQGVKGALSSSGDHALKTARLLLAIPEWQVHLPGGGHPSQNDLFCLGVVERDGCPELLAVMVEGKAQESFGPTVEGWRAKPSPGKDRRLASLKTLLGLSDVTEEVLDEIRYQLLHRTASALLTAREFTAPTALVLIHAFDSPPKSFADFERFVRLLGLAAERGAVMGPTELDGIATFFGWVDG